MTNQNIGPHLERPKVGGFVLPNLARSSIQDKSKYSLNPSPRLYRGHV
jgi:hypothetical protein